MECPFTVGQEVVCIATEYVGYTAITGKPKTYKFSSWITVGNIYTVAFIEPARNPANPPRVGFKEVPISLRKGLPSVCFRPLITLDMFSEEVKELENV